MNRFIHSVVYPDTMKVNRVFLTATVAVISAVAVSSCAYDPYYSGSSYSSGPDYYSGYGSGYGYGNRSFTTTYFISTGQSRWGYDPYARCYYDYSRRCYYDPYLNGYYPAGYRPRYVYGAPHPHSWSSGSRYIAPPSRIHDHRLNDYQNRSEQYRGLNNDWSRNVQVNSQTQPTESYRDRYTSTGQDRGSRSPSFFGSSNQGDPRNRTSDQTRATYGDPRSRMSDPSRNNSANDTQSSRQSDPRTLQPRQESPRYSRQEQMNQHEGHARPSRQAGPNPEPMNQHEGHTRPSRQVEPRQEREGRRNETVNPQVSRQSTNGGGDTAVSGENTQVQQPANIVPESVGN